MALLNACLGRHCSVVGCCCDHCLVIAGRAGPSPDKPRQPTAMRTAASDDSSLSSQQWGKTTARARAAVARAVLSPQHSVSSGDSLRRSSSSNSGQRSSIATSQDSPEHDSGDYMPLPGQSHRHLDSEMRQGEDSSYNALQRNLLAQYKDSSEGYRPQVKAAEGSSVTFGRGQPLQALPEASSSAFQVSHHWLKTSLPLFLLIVCSCC